MERKLNNSTPTNTALKYLRNELIKVKGENAGVITTGTSISSRLTLVLKAFNDSAKQTGLDIKTIDITEKNIIISGNVSSRSNTTKLIEILKKTGLDVASSTISPAPDGKGDSIRFVLEPTS